MRLKVSPKTAITKIDALVQEGAEMVSWYSDTYDEVKDAAAEERQEKEEAREREIEALRNEPDTIDVEMPYGIKMAMPNTRKMMQLPRMQLSSVNLFPEPTEAGELRMMSTTKWSWT